VDSRSSVSIVFLIEEKMMKKRLLVILVIALVFLVTGVSAHYVSFADPDSTAHKDMYLYNSTGALLGVYNTTSAAIDLTGVGDVFFVMKPQYSNPLDDPGTFLTNAIGFLQTNVLSLLIIGMLGGLLFKRF
jgi:hypothetical protein